MKYLLIFLTLIISQQSFSQNDTLYWPSGSVRSIYFCHVNKCTTKLYYQNGMLKEVTENINGFTWIMEEQYCENGQLLIKHNPSAKTPELIIEYNCAGDKVLEYFKTAKGKRGLYKSFHNTGQVSEQGDYEKTAKAIGEQRVGIWQHFHGNGTKFKETTWEDGQKVKIQQFE